MFEPRCQKADFSDAHSVSSYREDGSFEAGVRSRPVAGSAAPGAGSRRAASRAEVRAQELAAAPRPLLLLLR